MRPFLIKGHRETLDSQRLVDHGTMSGGFYNLSSTGGVAMTLLLDRKGLRRSPKTTVKNRMHQSKQFGELVATANGVTLMKSKYCDAMDGYYFGSMETEKE